MLLRVLGKESLTSGLIIASSVRFSMTKDVKNTSLVVKFTDFVVMFAIASDLVTADCPFPFCFAKVKLYNHNNR